MKWYRGVVACATIATLALILFATINLHAITSTLTSGREYPCPNCGDSSQESESRVLFSAKEKNPATNLLQRSALNFITNTAVLAEMNRSSSPQPVTLHSEGIEAPQDCAQKNCLEYLSDSEKRGVSACAGRVRTKDHYKGPIRQSECKFLPSTGRGPVALVSARGSGNTWTRGLLEKATGICTGFISCDTAMRAHGYIGENVKSGKVLVVKTHSVVPKWRGEKNSHAKPDDARYTSAVLILRNPAESAIAEWNRRSAEKVLGKHNISIAQERHTYTIPKEFFEGKGWDSFLHKHMKDWSARLHQWVINQDKHPVHILHYEYLKQDTVGEIEKTLDFMNVSYDSDTLRSKLIVDYSEFQRPHDSKDFEHYSLEQKEFLRSVLLEVKGAAERASKANLLPLDKYMPSF